RSRTSEKSRGTGVFRLIPRQEVRATGTWTRFQSGCLPGLRESSSRAPVQTAVSTMVRWARTSPADQRPLPGARFQRLAGSSAQASSRSRWARLSSSTMAATSRISDLTMAHFCAPGAEIAAGLLAPRYNWDSERSLKGYATGGPPRGTQRYKSKLQLG